DDGSLLIEDLAAISDLAAGALAELSTGFVDQDLFPVRGVISPLPADLSWKTRLIGSWMAHEYSLLRKLTCIIELKPTSPRTRVSVIRWHAMPGHIFVP